MQAWIEILTNKHEHDWRKQRYKWTKSIWNSNAHHRMVCFLSYTGVQTDWCNQSPLIAINIQAEFDWCIFYSQWCKPSVSRILLRRQTTRHRVNDTDCVSSNCSLRAIVEMPVILEQILTSTNTIYEREANAQFKRMHICDSCYPQLIWIFSKYSYIFKHTYIKYTYEQS